MKKAEQLGIKVIGEDDIMSMIASQTGSGQQEKPGQRDSDGENEGSRAAGTAAGSGQLTLF